MSWCCCKGLSHYFMPSTISCLTQEGWLWRMINFTGGNSVGFRILINDLHTHDAQTASIHTLTFLDNWLWWFLIYIIVIMWIVNYSRCISQHISRVSTRVLTSLKEDRCTRTSLMCQRAYWHPWKEDRYNSTSLKWQRAYRQWHLWKKIAAVAIISRVDACTDILERGRMH